MRNCYTFSVEGHPMQPIADLIEPGLMDANRETWWISRINVPHQHRGKGYGSRLLSMLCEAADQDRVWLALEILASGPLGDKDLEAWYGRYGFRCDVWGVWRREPQPRH